ncbi:MAG TPA: hypothetical protein VE223_02305 [Nitrososphaeraceae archaeon]|nr:hypothetical protein [Nitrososphaeraceae archaeon]
MSILLMIKRKDKSKLRSYSVSDAKRLESGYIVVKGTIASVSTQDLNRAVTIRDVLCMVARYLILLFCCHLDVSIQRYAPIVKALHTQFRKKTGSINNHGVILINLS